MKRRTDLVGQKFSLLTVSSLAYSRNGRLYWNCTCECGENTIVCTRNLRTFRIKSCGCLEHIAKYKKHNLSRTRIYTILKGMKGRCYNPNNKDYKNYGGRGIRICDSWLDKENGVKNFYNWAINNGYSENLSIDRIDVNGNYCPENCRWLSIKGQSNNRRGNFYIEYKDKRLTAKQWSEITGINSATLIQRIKLGWNIEDVFNIPTDSKTKLSFRKKEKA